MGLKSTIQCLEREATPKFQLNCSKSSLWTGTNFCYPLTKQWYRQTRQKTDNEYTMKSIPQLFKNEGKWVSSTLFIQHGRWSHWKLFKIICSTHTGSSRTLETVSCKSRFLNYGCWFKLQRLLVHHFFVYLVHACETRKRLRIIATAIYLSLISLFNKNIVNGFGQRSLFTVLYETSL